MVSLRVKYIIYEYGWKWIRGVGIGKGVVGRRRSGREILVTKKKFEGASENNK